MITPYHAKPYTTGTAGASGIGASNRGFIHQGPHQRPERFVLTESNKVAFMDEGVEVSDEVFGRYVKSSRESGFLGIDASEIWLAGLLDASS